MSILNHHNPANGIWIIDNPNMPVDTNMNASQKAQLNGYLKGIMKHADFICEMQKGEPGWLPVFKMI
ncbi:hypothetical protein J3L18_00190 [Mucilaginibacter gossypii]|uniref:hypothetical protein n=1 Tax=Mucilaginibacter gossypii TaxID=551996 RepID=UPI000DCC0BFA|nr:MULTISPECIES: hypothetical protein [Mucilaginibacter]QTE37522.1 hypothetical protein J3L18_00190 [Mucilaginibacter gossypii]RAV52348.1 hypothetical protein DIU36_24750 [Mucilaginibacter rubeus]